MRTVILVVVGFFALVFAKVIGETVGKATVRSSILGYQEGGLAELIRLVAVDMNKQLPVTVDTNTLLLAVTSSGTTMNYHHKLNRTYNEQEREIVQRNITDHLPKRVCSQPKMRVMLDKGVSYSYQYVDAHGMYLGEVLITADSCAPPQEDYNAALDELLKKTPE